MKRSLLFLFVGLLFSIVQIKAQVVTIPLAEGANGGGGLLTYDVATQRVTTIPNLGAIGFGRVSEILPLDAESTELGGLYYHQLSGNIYITIYKEQQPIFDVQPHGIVVKFNIYSKELNVVHRFSEDADNGLGGPNNALTLHTDGLLYGVARYGGQHGGGAIFTINPDTDSFQIEYEFNSTIEGSLPTIIESLGGHLYASTRFKKNQQKGYSLYEFNTSQKTVTELAESVITDENYTVRDLDLRNGQIWIASNANIDTYDLTSGQFDEYVPPFIKNAGWRSVGFLQAADTRFYALFTRGGTGDVGTISEINFSAGAFTNRLDLLHSFAIGNGYSPRTAMIEGLQGIKYGLAIKDGKTNTVLYEYRNNGVYKVLQDFSENEFGKQSFLRPVFVADTLGNARVYGISNDYGKNSGGTIWSYDVTQNKMEVELAVGFPNGHGPLNIQLLSDGTFLGTNSFGSTGGKGAAFILDEKTAQAKTYPFHNTLLQTTSSSFTFQYDGELYLLYDNREPINLSSTVSVSRIDQATGNLTDHLRLSASISEIVTNKYSVFSNPVQRDSLVYFAHRGALSVLDIKNRTWSNIHNLDANSEGNKPVSLSLKDDALYILTEVDGPNGKGAFNKYDLTSNTMSTLFSASSVDFVNFHLVSESEIYLTSNESNQPVQNGMYKWDGASLSKVADFDQATGFVTSGQLSADGDFIYGITEVGGQIGLGSLYRFNMTNNQIERLVSLDQNTGYYASKYASPIIRATSNVDADFDGVIDANDLCLGTSQGEKVNADGCSLAQLDSDNDGVSDDLDHCPNTPAGETVDVHGCSNSQTDGDGDGVVNSLDLCPNTPAGETVDANGCSDAQRDDDGDGVLNADDHCPNTPAGETVDVHGCAPGQIDGDGDGVPNGIDKCPNTPAGESVNADGCAASERDTDGDGLTDDLDQCPNSPAGEAVDANGCADSEKDTDGDGVNDAIDHCPNTAAGETVDQYGCSAPQNDGDGDGVLNQFDKCPNTPAGASVTADGCADSQKDTDRDGVTDDLDKCANTPVGQTVNAQGCAESQIDTDGDGVVDAIDHCPNTPSGEQADANGCSASQSDSDNDGVKDDKDLCPNTLPGAAVDSNGCATNQLDDDKDGVTNNNDQCANTPIGEAVDANGCSLTQKDGDSDGVNDAIDHCPNSPAGSTVDANGCTVAETDGDGDGVPNGTDQCPNTPAGETVDANGCADSQKDTDGDGIVDSQDVCPNTPRNETADATGCSASQKDADRDGVQDNLDQCPNTLPGSNVNANGCSTEQIDSDGDGVPNDTDACPNTPAGASVSSTGCATSQVDSDNDGVTNDLDQCPNTPSGESVDSNGCSLPHSTDADADGVIDAEDHCPNTPAGAVVDIHGCADVQKDSDGDGVPNNQDLCPNTPAGTEVNSQGCPAYRMSVLGQPVFEDTPLGLITTSTFEILNSGSNDGLNISSIEAPTGFSVDVSTLSLNAGQSATVTVSFQPIESRTYSGVITINSSNVDSQTISVTGAGAIITEIPDNLSPKLINLLPNPVEDLLTIDLGNLTLTDPHIYIYDLNGVIKYHQEGFRSRREVINVRSYASGIYLVRVQGKEGELIKKFIRR